MDEIPKGVNRDGKEEESFERTMGDERNKKSSRAASGRQRWGVLKQGDNGGQLCGVLVMST